ncbi:MAG: hypothetical protein WCK89_25975, partial [bacterium]
MTKRFNEVTGPIPLGVAGGLMFGAFLAVWQRVLDAVAGQTVYTLTAFAGVVALGVTVGFIVAWWLCRRMTCPMVLLRLVFLLLACWLVFQLAAVKGVAGGWQRILMDTTRTFDLAMLTLGRTTVFLFGVPAVLAGVAGQLLLQQRVRTAPQQNRQATIGILGAVLVSASAGYTLGAGVLVPWVGVEGFTRLAALWFGALASIAVLAGVSRWTGIRLVLACVPF